MSALDLAIDRARETDLLDLARRYTTLKKVAANEYAGPCPKCAGHDRFAVNIQKRLWLCRGCGVGGGVIDLIMHVEGIDFRLAIERLAGEGCGSGAAFHPRRAVASSRASEDEDAARRQHEKARWLWGRREPLAGTIAETYLREARRYGGPLPPTLAFLRAYRDYPPSLICAFGMTGEIEPGILAPPRDVGAVQLIALKRDGSGKADAVDVADGAVKRTIGSHKGLPTVISPPNDGLGLSIHEGVEDALSAYQATGLGCWASGGAGFLPALADAVPSFIECVTIVGHNDDAGRAGARTLAHCLNEKGFEVLLNGDAPDGRS